MSPAAAAVRSGGGAPPLARPDAGAPPARLIPAAAAVRSGGGGPGGSGNPRHVYNFPATMPEVYLRPEQVKERYGMSKANAPVVVRGQVDTFLGWGTSMINLDRGVRYAAAIQSATAETQESSLMAYMGYTELYFPLRPANMRAYLDPEIIIIIIMIRPPKVGREI